MDYKEFLKELLKSSELKLEEAEAFLIKDKQIQIEIYEGEINKYIVAESGGLSLRGSNEGKMGYAYTERIDPSSIDMLVEEALENSRYIDDGEKEIIFEGSPSYEDIDNFNQGLIDFPLEDKISFLKDLELEAKRLDDRVFSVNACAYQEFENHRFIRNSKGVDLEDRSNGAFAYLSVVVKEGEDTKTGMSFRVIKDFSELDYKEIASEAVESGLSMLGAESIESDNYPIVFENKTFANLLSAFISVFSADNVQKGLSALKDRMGDKIASSLLTLVDDPLLEDGFASRNFDDEGTRTSFKKLIDKGSLTSFIYNWKAANKDGIESTGNASRSYKGQVSISPSNLYVERGTSDLSELLETLDRGLFIDNLQGLHSGLNPVSGDFSLSASGYEIIEGKRARAVNQITIAGNLYDLLMDIEAIGKDLEFTIPSNGYIGSPSIKVKSLSVAGK